MPYYDLPADPPSPSVNLLRTRQAKRRRRGMAWFIVILLLTAALGVGAWWMFSGRFIDTPAFASLTQKAAVQLAEKNGLQVDFENEFSESVKAGQVIRTNPVEGSPVLRGGSVTAYLSKGPERFDVPELAGMTIEQAQAELAESNLTLGKVENAYHETAEIGTITGMAIEPGERVKRDTPIGVTVSKGPAPVKIVSFKGKPFEEAKEHYEKAGLKVEISEEKNDKKIPEGSVISSDPAKGELERGETISFVVSKGPVLVKIPSVIYKNADTATEILEKAGFKVKVVHTNNLLGLVYETKPGYGQDAPEGSTVTIYLT